MSDEPAKALAVRQPWAWAIVYAGKDIENRSEAAARVMTHAIGSRIFIHAAKALSSRDYDDSAEWLGSLDVECPPRETLRLGGLIGSVQLAQIVRNSASRWFFGPYGLVLADPKPCAFLPVEGQLNLFWVKSPHCP